MFQLGMVQRLAAPMRRLARSRTALAVSGGALVVLVVIAVSSREPVSAAAPVTNARELPRVIFVNAHRGKASAEISLPASLQALQEATVYARTNGYIKRWLAEMGDQVKAGQVLAEIEAPELDHEIDQVRATQSQVKAQLDLARSTADRYRSLVKDEAVSPQEADEKIGALAAREADFAAAQARLRQLESMKAYQRVLAPFGGTVTARNVEVGSLVSAGSSSATPWLYKIAQSQTMRVFVSVPQSQMQAARIGSDAELTIPELGGKPIPVKVARNAGSFDPATRTLLVELRVANPDGRILPGMYGQVRFQIKYAEPPMLVPVNALMVGGEGLRLAVIDETDTVRIRTVKLGRDLGKEVEILEGLEDGERVVNNPRDEVPDGTRVRALVAATHGDKKKDDKPMPGAKPAAAPPQAPAPK
ncbi:MAG: efflux RND transporter periplasmic adaptor subunit [Betaproteobacteria bacterium]